jgi:putative transposase
MSQRRACRVISTHRTSVRYQASRPDDGALRERLKALAQSDGASAIGRSTCCCGARANKKRVPRIHREERLTVRRCGGRSGRSAREGRSRRRWPPTSNVV